MLFASHSIPKRPALPTIKQLVISGRRKWRDQGFSLVPQLPTSTATRFQPACHFLFLLSPKPPSRRRWPPLPASRPDPAAMATSAPLLQNQWWAPPQGAQILSYLKAMSICLTLTTFSSRGKTQNHQVEDDGRRIRWPWLPPAPLLR